MKLVFDPNQDFQIQAIDATLGVFTGMNCKDGREQIIADDDFNMLPGTMVQTNRLTISEQEILSNIRNIQSDGKNRIRESEVSDALSFIESTEENTIETKFPNFSVEMETGTGKTYVYFRTIFEMYKQYGFSKFVVLVPSVAIREGVTNSAETFREHFKNIYPGTNWTINVYSTKSISEVRDFALSTDIQILVMNIDTFNKKDMNLFYRENENLSNSTPADFIRSTSPILIVDEPQSVANTPLAKASMCELNPLFCLRYSATHVEKHSMLYRLSPVDAYNLGLVKKILVNSVTEAIGDDSAYLRINSVSKSLVANVDVDQLVGSEVVRKAVKLKVGDDLKSICGRQQYDGYIVEEIDNGVSPAEVVFENGHILTVGESNGLDQDFVFKEMIDQTILDHLSKERELQSRSEDEKIKVLSLFFIDKVSNYHIDSDNPKFRVWFEESYNKYRSQKRFSSLQLPEVSLVHGGYFAIDKKGVPKDSKDKATISDNDAYELIMKDKERLLSFDEPLRFIFSHSALREGWDNPNVFQICNLQQVRSNIRRRQQIGRGLRLPVQRNGLRCMDESVCKLTIIANDSLASFAGDLQSEMVDDGYIGWKKDMVKSVRARRRLNLRDGWQLDPNFKKIWESIRKKTRYSISFSTKELISSVVDTIDSSDVVINPPSLKVRKAELRMDDSHVEVSDLLRQKSSTLNDIEITLPDPIAWLQDNTELSRITIATILKKSARFDEIYINPEQFLRLCLISINEVLDEMLIKGIRYHLTGEYWNMELFEKYPLEAYLSNEELISKGEVKTGIIDMDTNKCLYDGVIYDSGIEKDFALAADAAEETILFFKLPHWFKINTPIGKHNPDWVVLHSQFDHPLIVETKGTNDENELTPSERRKIRAGRKHGDVLPNCAYFGPIKTYSKLINYQKSITGN